MVKYNPRTTALESMLCGDTTYSVIRPIIYDCRNVEHLIFTETWESKEKDNSLL